MFIEYRQKINYAYSYKKNLHTHTQTQKNFIHKKIFIHTYSNKQKKLTHNTHDKNKAKIILTHIYIIPKKENSHTHSNKKILL